MDFLSKRIVLVTGKGGVGRTTVTAAMARAAASVGRRVLVVEIGEPDGDYSPLARIFGRETLPLKVEEIEPGIRGSLLYSRRGHALFLEAVLPIPALVRAGMRSKALRRFLDFAPSFSEMGVYNHLLHLLERRRSNADGDDEYEYELIVVDMPATGHTLALTGLPMTLLKLVPTGPVADLLRAGMAVLQDPRQSAACLVTLPEILPVSECLELIEGLHATRVPVGGVFVNKVVDDTFDDEERRWLTPLVVDAPIFGGAKFLALAQSGEALARLRADAHVPLGMIPEFGSMESALVDDIAEAILEQEERA